MSLITKIESQKRNNERFNVFLDGKYAFAVSLEVFAKKKLKKGLNLSDSEIEEIVVEETYVKTFSKTLDFISYQTRTKKEIDKKLNDLLYKSVEDEKLRDSLKKKIFNRLDDLNLINDLNYAQIYVKQKSESNKPLGYNKLKEFLLKKGIDIKIINDVLVNYSQEDQLKGAIYFAEKKLKSLKNKEENVIKQKLWRHLASKGYSSSIVSAAVDTVLKL